MVWGWASLGSFPGISHGSYITLGRTFIPTEMDILLFSHVIVNHEYFPVSLLFYIIIFMSA